MRISKKYLLERINTLESRVERNEARDVRKEFNINCILSAINDEMCDINEILFQNRIDNLPEVVNIPTGNLDDESKALLLQLLNKLNGKESND